MLEPTIHHLFETLPYLANVMELPLGGLEALAVALAAAVCLVVVFVARTLTR